jgi:hypothetical protein
LKRFPNARRALSGRTAPPEVSRSTVTTSENAVQSLRALVRDALDDRLHALEAPRRIEVRALAARVQLGTAVRALRERVSRDREHAAALGAARRGLALEDAEGAAAAGRRKRRVATLATAARASTAVALLVVLPVARTSHGLTPRGTS